MVTFIKKWWPSALTFAVVLWLTLSPDPVGDIEPPSFLGPYADKIIHFIMFGGLTGAVVFDAKRAIAGTGKRLSLTFYTLLGVCMLAFAIADEWAQGAMGFGRTADIFDFMADGGGILTALLIAPPVVNRVLRLHPRKK